MIDRLNFLHFNTKLQNVSDEGQFIVTVLTYFYKKFYRFCFGKWYYFDVHSWKTRCSYKVMKKLFSSLSKTLLTIESNSKTVIDGKIYYSKSAIDTMTRIKSTLSKSFDYYLNSCDIDLKLEKAFNDPTFAESLDSNSSLLGFKNGIFDAKIMRLRNETPEDLIFKSTTYKYKEFNPNSPTVKKLTTLLNQWLGENVDYFMSDLFRIIFGMTTMHHVFWLGDGNNGKTSAKKIIFGALGNYCGEIGYFPDSEESTDLILSALNKCRLVFLEDGKYINNYTNNALLKSLGCCTLDRKSNNSPSNHPFTLIQINNAFNHPAGYASKVVHWDSTFVNHLSEPNDSDENKYKSNPKLIHKIKKYKKEFMWLLLNQ